MQTAEPIQKQDPWQIEAPGVLDSRSLPDEDFEELWNAILVDQELKDQLLAQGVLNFTLRPNVSAAQVPLHGLLLLVGPPGTGKTSLARGLASRIAETVVDAGHFRYIEVEPHAVAASALGRSQKAVIELFGQTIAEAADQPVIVLLDEVETLAGSRARMSLEANPVDVHRATDALLAQLDHLASRHKNVLFIATSNFPEAIDDAFLSRADLIRDVGLPDPQACRDILRNTLEALASTYPPLRKLLESPDVEKAAEVCVGLDGRQIRKVVVSALAQRKELALDPGQLQGSDVLAAAEAAKRQLNGKRKEAS